MRECRVAFLRAQHGCYAKPGVVHLRVALLFDGQLIVNAMRALGGSCGAEHGVNLCLTSHHTR